MSALANAFLNVCMNAVDAMPDGGTLTMRTRNAPGGQVVVALEDSGEGMPSEVLAKAMDPFFTTKEVGKGTGLGLPLVFSTVKAHQAEMEIRSTVGQGTLVTLRFPACVPEGAAPEAPAGFVPGEDRRGLKVLIVDDDELIQKSSGMLFEVLGHPARAAHSGEEALAMLQAGYRPGVVILDMNMPGLGGLGTLPRLRALCPEVPVLLATGRVDQDALDLVAHDPHAALLSKPFSLADLQGVLEAMVGAG